MTCTAVHWHSSLVNDNAPDGCSGLTSNLKVHLLASTMFTIRQPRAESCHVFGLTVTYADIDAGAHLPILTTLAMSLPILLDAGTQVPQSMYHTVSSTAARRNKRRLYLAHACDLRFKHRDHKGPSNAQPVDASAFLAAGYISYYSDTITSSRL
jgi:hypothetical protein